MCAKMLKAVWKVGFFPSFVFLSFVTTVAGDFLSMAVGIPFRLGLPLIACWFAVIAIDFPHRSRSTLIAAFLGGMAGTLVLLPHVPESLVMKAFLSFVLFVFSLAFIEFALAPVIRFLQDKYPPDRAFGKIRIARPED
jgi:hypothetical protein